MPRYEHWMLFEAFGDSAALKKLIQYNEADTRNLAPIASVVYKRLCLKPRA